MHSARWVDDAGQTGVFTRMKDALMGNQTSLVDADLEFIIDSRDKINSKAKDGLFAKMVEFEAALLSHRSSKAAIKPPSVNTEYFQLTNEDCQLHKEVQAAGGEIRQRLSKMDASKSEKGRGSTSRSKVWAVMINPAEIPMAPGESVQDALCTFRRWTLLDIYLCIQTWGLYYIFYLRRELSASHAMILTDRRLITVTKQGLIGNKVQDAIHRASSVILDKVKCGCVTKTQMGVQAAVQTKNGVLHIEPRHNPLNPCIWYLPPFYRSRHLDFVLKLASSVDAKNFLPGQSAAVWDVENAGMGMLDPLAGETVTGALDGDLGKSGDYCGPLTAPLTCFILPFKLVQRLRITTHRLWYYMYHKNFAPLPMCQSKSEIMAWSHLDSMTGYEIYGETQLQESCFTRIMGCFGCTAMKCCTPGYAEMQFKINTKDMPILPGDALRLDPKPMFAINRVNKKSKGDGLVATDDIAQARQMMGVLMAARQAHKSSE
ncbi:hypothetical protein CYMTET_49181 [Cymbomonas tetramitiformis]|uniref:Uncharacterized protein n=1 Tax=Cymbomonas tetramitiformis TaxID=36881 RepID=A0AAE0BSN8_9CHLO|nr:hypothetical protein CYMTET_49181 [Cymbomonas tetramitiformis]